MSRPEPISFPVGVAYVLPGLGRGGTEKHVADLASRLDRRRFAPCVISTALGGPMEEELGRRGVPVFLLDYRGLSVRPGKFLPLLRGAREFFRGFSGILAERRVAILHAYLHAANILGMAAAVSRRTKVRIVSKRALCRYKVGHPVYSLFEDLAHVASDAVMVNSLAVAQDVRRSERFLGGKVFLCTTGWMWPRGNPPEGTRRSRAAPRAAQVPLLRTRGIRGVHPERARMGAEPGDQLLILGWRRRVSPSGSSSRTRRWPAARPAAADTSGTTRCRS